MYSKFNQNKDLRICPRYHITIILVFIIMFTTSLFPQTKEPAKRVRSYNSKTFNQVQSALMKAKRYETLLDYNKAYTIYENLIRTNYKEPDILNGYVKSSVKIKKIKISEIKLKELIVNYKTENDTEQDSLEILLESFLGQLFLMTGREMQGNEIIKKINASNISSKLKYEMKGRMYYESSDHKNASEQYLQARKELKDDSIFSRELFITYKSGNLINAAANELVNIFLKEDKQVNREKRLDVFSANYEMIKLFEAEENREEIIEVVIERSKRNQELLYLLSELYFMNKDYENSYLVIKDQSINKNELSNIISFAYRLFQDKEYKSSADFYSLYFTENKKIQEKELDQFIFYIDALLEIGQIENCIKKLSTLEYPKAKIKLAYLYHLSGEWKISKKNYEQQFDTLKSNPEEFLDYVKLLITLKEYSKTSEIIKNTFDDKTYHIVKSTIFDQLIYLDTLLSLLQKDKEGFLEKYKLLSEDTINSDTDNDIIKIKNDLEIIADDDELMNSYLDYISYQIDPTNDYEIIPASADKIEDKAKKLFVLKLNYYYLKASKNNQAQSKIITEILNQNPSGSEIGMMLLEHCDNPNISYEDKNEILMSLIKGEYSDLIKSRARKIIRQK